jgi:hypothetical protein
VPLFVFIGQDVLLPGEAAVYNDNRLAVLIQEAEALYTRWKILKNNPLLVHAIASMGRSYSRR